MAFSGSKRYSPKGVNQQQVSEYTPWMQEFIRLDTLITACDELAIHARRGNTEVIEDYWVILYQVYMLLKPYMSWKMRGLFYKKNKLLKTLIEDYADEKENGVFEFPSELIRILTDYHQCILTAKHILGLSIPMTQKIDYKQRMSHALLGKS